MKTPFVALVAVALAIVACSGTPHAAGPKGRIVGDFVQSGGPLVAAQGAVLPSDVQVFRGQAKVPSHRAAISRRPLAVRSSPRSRSTRVSSSISWLSLGSPSFSHTPAAANLSRCTSSEARAWPSGSSAPRAERLTAAETRERANAYLDQSTTPVREIISTRSVLLRSR